MADTTFTIYEDDWGLVTILPRENADQFRNVNKRYREHYKDTEFGPNGWSTPPFLVPSAEVSIAQRKITLDDLRSIFSADFHEADSVNIQDPSIEKDGFQVFAFVRGTWAVYGSIEDGYVTELNCTNLRPKDSSALNAIIKSLHVLGEKYDLALQSEANYFIDLKNNDALRAYLEH